MPIPSLHRYRIAIRILGNRNRSDRPRGKLAPRFASRLPAMRARAPQCLLLTAKKWVKKEKQPWQSQRCFPGCVLEVVCLVRRRENEMVAQVRKILDKQRIFVSRRS